MTVSISEMDASDRNDHIAAARQRIQTALDTAEQNTPELKAAYDFLADIYLWRLNEQSLENYIVAAAPEDLTFLRNLSVLLGKWAMHCNYRQQYDAEWFLTRAKVIINAPQTPESNDDWQVMYLFAKVQLERSAESDWSTHIENAARYCKVAHLMLNGTQNSALNDLTAQIHCDRVANYDKADDRSITALARYHSDPRTAAIPVMSSGHHMTSSSYKLKQAIYTQILALEPEAKQRALWSALIPGTALHAVFATLRHDFSHNPANTDGKANYGSGFLKTILKELKTTAMPIVDEAIVAALALEKCHKLVSELRHRAPQLLPPSSSAAPVSGHAQAAAAVTRGTPATTSRLQVLEQELVYKL